MDLALQKLQLCHGLGNSSLQQWRPRSNKVHTAAAAPTTPPPTLAQRALLQTAARRTRSLQQQQQQQGNGSTLQQDEQWQQQQRSQNILQQEQNVRNSMLQLQELVAGAHHTIADQHQQQKTGVQQKIPEKAPSFNAQQPPVPQQQQQQATPFPEQLHQQQQLLLQRHLALQQLQQQQRNRQLQLRLRREPGMLTALIKRRTSWQRLQQLFTDFTPVFNPVHVSAAITHLAQLQPEPFSPLQLAQAPEGFQQLVRDLTAAAVACIPDYGPRQLSNSLWAISRLGGGDLVPRKLRLQFLTAFAEKVQYAAPQHVANVAAAVANMGWPTSTEWQQQILQAAAVRLQFFKPQELASFLHALPRLGAHPSAEWLSGFLAACCSNMYSFSPQELGMLAVSLSRLQHRPQQDWLEVYLHAVQLQLAATVADPVDDDAAAAVDAGTGTGTGTGAGFQSNAEKHMSEQGSHSATYSSSSSHGLIFSQLQPDLSPSSSSDGDYQHSSSASAMGSNSTAASNDASSSSSIDGFADSQIMSPSARGFCPQGLVMVLRALSVWDVQLTPSFGDSCLAVVQRQFGSFSVQGVSTLLWSLARLQVQVPDEVLLQLLQHSQPLLPQAKPTDLAMMAWGLGTMGVTTTQLVAVANSCSSSSTTTTNTSLAWPQRASTAGVSSRGTGQQQQQAAEGALDGPACSVDAVASDSSVAGAQSSNTSNATSSSSSRSTCSQSLGASWLSDFLYFSYRVMPEASAADVSSLLVGVVRMRLIPGRRWLQSAAIEALHRLDLMDATELSSTLLSLVRLRCKPNHSFLQAFADRSSALLAAAAAGAPGSRTAPKCGRQRKKSTAVPVLAADESGSLGLISKEKPDCLAAAAAGGRSYNPHSLANTVGAFATLGFRPSQAWCSSFLSAARVLLPRFAGRDFAFTMWALALLDIEPPQAWMDAYLVHLRAHVPTMTSQQLSAVIWGLARLNHRPGVDWMNRFLDRVVDLTPQTSEPSSSRTVGRSSSSSTVHSSSSDAVDPQSPLQLSGYFSAIILQGLTVWAAARLNIGLDGSHTQSSSSHSGTAETARPRRRQSHGPPRIRRICRSGELQVVEASAAGSSPTPECSEGFQVAGAAVYGAGVRMTTSNDGSIVYHF